MSEGLGLGLGLAHQWLPSARQVRLSALDLRDTTGRRTRPSQSLSLPQNRTFAIFDHCVIFI